MLGRCNGDSQGHACFASPYGNLGAPIVIIAKPKRSELSGPTIIVGVPKLNGLGVLPALAGAAAVIIAGWRWIVAPGLALALLEKLRQLWAEKNSPTTTPAKTQLEIAGVINRALEARSKGEITEADLRTIMSAVGEHFPESKPPAVGFNLGGAGGTIAAAVVAGLVVTFLARRLF